MKTHSEVEEDRISDLPASLLHHILSFVDTRTAARTSVLSIRWKYIWRSIPVLQFRCKKSSQADKFTDFVDRTMRLHDESKVHKFYLKSDVHLNEPRIKRWINTVTRHNVEDLTLGLNQRDPILVPSSLYSCESLTSLILNISPSICFPKCISFPRLNILMLYGVEFGGECYNEQLFSHCPVLELLTLGDCSWYDMKRFCISNPVLKTLLIDNPREEEDGLRNCTLKIHAPNLERLCYVGTVAKDYVLSSFPKLVKAHIDFLFEEYAAMSEQEIDDYGAAVSKFLRSLAHVVILRISNQTLQVLSVADDLLNNLPSFHNLHQLILARKLTADKALIALLETAPNLVSLEFTGFASPFPDKEEDDNDNDDSGDEWIEVVDDSGEDEVVDDGSEDEEEDDAADGDENDGWMLDMVVARCSLSHLKLVSFKKFTGNAWELSWVKLVLKNAGSLQTMTIDPISSIKKENIMADISKLPRASTNCVFKFPTKMG